jgi:hypothetical protein
MTDVLIHVEDPGAANMVIGLPEMLKCSGYKTTLCASSHAKSCLAIHAEPYCEWNRSAQELLASEKPKTVVVGTSGDSNALSLQVTAECRPLGIPTVGLVDMACNAQDRFRGKEESPLAYAPDYLVVPDKVTEDAYRDLGFPPDKLATLGHPTYDRAFEYKSKHLNLKRQVSDKIRVLFLAEGWHPFDRTLSLRTKNYTLEGRGESNWRTAIVLEELLDALDSIPATNVEVVVRPHPKMSARDFERYAGEVIVQEGGDPLDAVLNADVVVGMTSILLGEAAILGCQVLSVLPNLGECEFLPPLINGRVEVVSTREELRLILPDLLSGHLNTIESGIWQYSAAKENIAGYIASVLNFVDEPQNSFSGK